MILHTTQLLLVLASALSTVVAQAATPPVAVGAETPPATGAERLYPAPPPRTQAELDRRMQELREQYAPYLRSLPKPLTVRTRAVLPGPWVSMSETLPKGKDKRDIAELDAKFLRMENAPDWWRTDLDESKWKPETVPSWRGNGGNLLKWYRTRFDAKPPADGRRVFLHFGGVDWRAQVWLNGKFVEEHYTYYEDFRLDVTDVLREENVLAVRLINGFGETIEFASHLSPPCMVADHNETLAKYNQQRWNEGYGIFRPVTLETTGAVTVQQIFARGDPATGIANIAVELDARGKAEAQVHVELLPENFTGDSFASTTSVTVDRAMCRQELAIACPGARVWAPETPYLYRCRVTVRQDGKVIDADDALFGFRSFAIATGAEPGVRRGQFLLNNKPIFLRGTNLQQHNVYWLWGESDKLIDVLLMMKAAHFNSARTIQHIPWPEVREIQDRLGILTEADVPGKVFGAKDPYKDTNIPRTGARVCYNNPGVILMSLINEGSLRESCAQMCEAVWAVDPQRVLTPASGGNPGLSDDYWKEHFTHLVKDGHDYGGWYEGGTTVPYGGRPVASKQIGGQAKTIGEFGAEGQDAYETLRTYPKHWGEPPTPDKLEFWRPIQAKNLGKPDDPSSRMAYGMRGKQPKNMLDMIQGSQTYQADNLGAKTSGYRLNANLNGYFQYHFMDFLPAQWPKSIVSHDFRPKQAYFELAQCNQPVAPLFRVNSGKMSLWVDNDLSIEFRGGTLKWRLHNANGLDQNGQSAVPPVASMASVKVHEMDLKQLPAGTDVATIVLDLVDNAGTQVARYERELYVAKLR